MTKALKNKDVSGTRPEERAAPAAPAAEKRRPLTTLRQGDVSASVWAREHQVRGEMTRFYSVTFERSYKDSTGKYCYTRSFNPDDLGALMALCQQASEYIAGQNGLEEAAAA
jgi:hypothetical protein